MIHAESKFVCFATLAALFLQASCATLKARDEMDQLQANSERLSREQGMAAPDSAGYGFMQPIAQLLQWVAR
jgi:hypothetical protein